MAITVNIYYTGEKGNARKFAQEMMEAGVVTAIAVSEAETRNIGIIFFL